MLLTYNFVACVRSSLRSAARPEAALARPVSGEIGRLDAVAVSRPAAVTDGGVAQHGNVQVDADAVGANQDAHVHARGHGGAALGTATSSSKSAAGAAAMVAACSSC